MPTLQYDDAAAVFFFVTLLVIYLVPASGYIAYRLVTFRKDVAVAHAGRSRAEEAKLRQLASEASGRQELWSRSFRVLCYTTAFLALVTLVLIARSGGASELAQYDPYAVLGIALGATSRDIKNAYRKLSLFYHPDKPTGNAEMFQKIAKAYEALTDPVARDKCVLRRARARARGARGSSVLARPRRPTVLRPVSPIPNTPPTPAAAHAPPPQLRKVRQP